MDTSEDAETSEAQLLADIQVDEILGSPEFAGAWTGKSSDSLSTAVGLRLEGVLARYAFSIDETEMAALVGAGWNSVRVRDWHTGAGFRKQIASRTGKE